MTIRVPKEMKEQMKKAGINLSEELRQVIAERLSKNQKDKAREELEDVLTRVRPGFDSARAIKQARKHG